jgi:uncharacterized membrane protein YidH (DUF202 family)
MKTVLKISFRGEIHEVAWYPGTTDSAIRDTIKETLQISPDVHIVLRDSSDCVIAVHSELPSDLTLRAEVRSPGNRKLLEDIDKTGGGASTMTPANSFRGELLKFERINAHLANERTWLAWVRTAISTMTCSFAFLSLSISGSGDSNSGLTIAVYLLGSAFCLAVLLVYVTGWLRYSRIKTVLGLSFSEMYDFEYTIYDVMIMTLSLTRSLTLLTHTH